MGRKWLLIKWDPCIYMPSKQGTTLWRGCPGRCCPPALLIFICTSLCQVTEFFYIMIYELNFVDILGWNKNNLLLFVSKIYIRRNNFYIKHQPLMSFAHHKIRKIPKNKRNHQLIEDYVTVMIFYSFVRHNYPSHMPLSWCYVDRTFPSAFPFLVFSLNK